MVDEGHAPVVAVLVPAVKISLMDDIGPRRPCRASAKERQLPFKPSKVKARLLRTPVGKDAHRAAAAVALGGISSRSRASLHSRI